jgi:hypothetical protein
MPDFCQTMSSLERVLKAYEQAGRALPLQYQCTPAVRPEAILIAICEGAGCSSPGGARRSRTDDILLAKQALYQLSYGPFQGEQQESCLRLSCGRSSRAGRPGQTRTADLTLIRRAL